jgi:hypothetical protein
MSIVRVDSAWAALISLGGGGVPSRTWRVKPQLVQVHQSLFSYISGLSSC